MKMLRAIEAQQTSLEEGAVKVTRAFHNDVPEAGFEAFTGFNTRLRQIRAEAAATDRMMGTVVAMIESGFEETEAHRRAPSLCAPVMAKIARLESDIELFLSDLD